METTVTYKFSPLDFVELTAYGLEVPGRVVGVGLQPGGIRTYEVEFAINGDIHKRLFYEDEISDKQKTRVGI